MQRVLLTALIVMVGAASSSPRAVEGRRPEGDPAFLEFWKADDPGDAAKVADRLLKAGIDFDAAWAELKAGRAYEKAPTGSRAFRSAAGGGAVFDNVVEIPADYDPARKWQVRVQLHGGVNRPAPGEDGRRRPSVNRIPGENQIYIHPRGWADASWWHATQVENILRLFDQVKRKYNVDESRVYVTGVSDGGTGAYYLALREPTPWSVFLPLNGNIKVLGSSSVAVDGELFVGNLVNRPFYIVNGGRDRLYPAGYVAPHVELLQRAGVRLVFSVHPDAGHDTSWWPIERPKYELYVGLHPRVAHPERLSWETERTDRYNRIQWLVIDALGAVSSDVPLEDPNSYVPTGADRAETMFPRRRASGRVDIVRRGNSYDANTRGVRELTVLLSPDVIDFARPVKITVNGVVAFDGPVRKDAATLLRWAARDNDRTMLYGAELKIKVP